MGYSGARGTLIYENNLMSKISCQAPFQVRTRIYLGKILYSLSPYFFRFIKSMIAESHHHAFQRV
jgi:hypothetical protein